MSTIDSDSTIVYNVIVYADYDYIGDNNNTFTLNLYW